MKRRKKDPLVDTHLCQPPRHDDGPDMGSILKDYLSPEAVAAIATIILSRIGSSQTPLTKVSRVNKELNWFGQELVDLVGGPEECHRLTEEIGL